jgi:hypothetical protein
MQELSSCKDASKKLTSPQNWPPAAAKKEKKNFRGTPPDYLRLIIPRMRAPRQGAPAEGRGPLHSHFMSGYHFKKRLTFCSSNAIVSSVPADP